METRKLTPTLKKGFKIIASKLPKPKPYIVKFEEGKLEMQDTPACNHKRRLEKEFLAGGWGAVERYILNAIK